MTVRIHTKARPWEEIEVSEAEARDLRRMGALADDQPRQGKPGDPAPKDPK
jgi:hypothetical protein